MTQPKGWSPADGDAMRRDELTMLTTLTCAVFVILLNETLTGVSLTVIAHELGTHVGDSQWATSAYMLTLAVLLPLTGSLLNRHRTRTIFRWSCGLLAVGVVISATAPTIAWLVAGRVIQAAGSVAVIPMLLTTILRTSTPGGRGRALSIAGLTTAVAPALGPAAAGMVLALTGWRGLFLLQLPLYLGLFIAAPLLRRDLRTGQSDGGFDLPSIALSVPGFGGVVVAAASVGAPVGLPALACGLLGISAFAWRQRALGPSRATLDLSTIRRRGFAPSALTLALVLVALFGAFALFPLLLLGTAHLTPLQAGLLMLPGGLLMGAVAPSAGRAADRGLGRVVIVSALVLLACGLTGCAVAANESAEWPVWFGLHLLIGFAFGLLMTPLYSRALAHVPEPQHAHASALLGITQQLAAATGTASAIALAGIGGRVPGTPGADGSVISLAVGAAIVLVATALAYVGGVGRRMPPSA
ncbi:MFS transporter [Leifsonia sp. fls2-241-R2A-40a]|uniref:MFS transporter n=1 Tax=Leifsonia sp. fls2-241-R2A-40a TaxID=3040290 RepID=UPI00254FD95F|nr:MFS transporter [Leifsonia sp. fls2-241-R2A-40a]